jgi:transcription elongation factor Elf1
MAYKILVNCAHAAFSCSLESATGSNMQIAIIRCTDCGEAIGAFLPQIPDAINSLNEKIDYLIKKK